MTYSVCESGFVNCSQILGQVVGEATSSTTGSLFLTFFIIMILVVAIFTMLRLRLEYSMILIMPLLLGYMSYYQEFIGIGAVILIYLAIVVTKNFIIR